MIRVHERMPTLLEAKHWWAMRGVVLEQNPIDGEELIHIADPIQARVWLDAYQRGALNEQGYLDWS